MTPQQIVGLAARLFSIWLILIAFQMLMIASAMREQLKGEGGHLIYVLPMLPLVCSAILWFFPMFIAHKLVPRTYDDNKLKLPVREIVAAASAIIGIWVIVTASPQIMTHITILIYTRNDYGMGTYLTPDRMFSMIAPLAQSLIGFFLVMKPWFVARKVFPDQANAPV
ncbi:hypothetical protein H8K35_10430 [Undibacterium sp. LX40W]|uniref:Uncharacterized protein n=1 Tax=Undibacterium nitidum TaxID=2762298 RepID=A0A923KPL1_9BURK|nr:MULTISPECIES: hypothetical protein [Undibacterium]MBC3881928.1 hypothetical protein [Undibacterium nitidum]MBC3892075.1 hypothetical protein [Undibacterium sp. LX40W]